MWAEGKFWYRLHSFQPDAGGNYIVGSFGSYKTGDYAKVEVDWKPLSEAEWRRLKAEREAAKQRGIRGAGEGRQACGSTWSRAVG